MGGMSLPPGFRFHPTDEELVGYYLKRKVDGLKIELEVIPVIDLYKFDPWELPDKSFLPKRDMEWFFFCPRDRKYPNGSRTNRATAAGYWKATGKDRKVVCHSSVCGLRKTLVFYRGRAPSGDRTDWVMHEYRLCGDSSQGSSVFEGAFSLCRVVKKNEQSPKMGEFHGESKAKNVVSSIKKSFSQGIFSSKASTTSEGSPSQANNIFNGCNDSTPITSPSEVPSVMEQGPTVTESDYASLWTSHDMVSDSSKAGDYNSGCIPQEEFYSSVAAWQPFNPMNYPYPSYFTEEINVSDDIDQIRCMSPYAKPMSYTEMFHYDDTEVQRLEWTESNTDINPITDGSESYNLTASPLICRQASGEGSFGELNGLWMKDDNMLIMM